MTTFHITMRGLIASVAGAALLSLTLPSTPAQAGFDWTPPPAAVKAPEATPGMPAAEAPAPAPNLLTPEPDAAPLTPVEPAPLTANDLPVPPGEQPAPGMKSLPPAPPAAAPVPVNATPAPTAAPAPLVAEAPEEKIEWQDKPATPPAAPATSSVARDVPPAPAMPVMPAAAPALDMTPVQGFGKDLPLAIALRQVAPANYAYRFDQGVSPGQKVSWKGGKPWPQVLSDMLAASNLQVVIVGNVISVQRSGTVSEATPAPQEANTAVAPEAPQAKPEAVTAKENLPEEKTAEKTTAKGAPAKETSSDDLPVPRTAYVPGSASAPKADAAPTNIQTEAQAAEATEMQTADDEPVAAVAVAPGKTAPVVDIQNSRSWDAKPGMTLRETLEKWSASAGAEIEWMSPYDYPVDHSFHFDGKFNDAVDSLLALYSRETPRPRGRLYPNLPTGPSVLMIN